MKSFTHLTKLFGYGLVAAATLASPALAQKAKDTLRFPVADMEAGLDSYLLPGSFTPSWAPSFFDNLLSYDPVKSAFVSQLATSWSQPDAVTYEFELKSGLTWHDGQPITADDAVYTINYLIDPKVTLRYKPRWAWIKSVEKLGPQKFRLVSKEPVPYGLITMASDTPIYPKHAHEPVANKLDFATRPIGSGPLRVTQFDKNTGIVAEKFEKFVPSAVKTAAGFGRLTAPPIQDYGTLTAALLTGTADVVRDLPIDQVVAMTESGKFEVSLAPPYVGYSFLGFPSTAVANVPALGDVRVRTAIMKAIDRDAIAKIRLAKFASGVSPSEALCSKEQLGCGYTKLVPTYDPAGAKKLLEEAGYANGFDVTISVFPVNVSEATAMAGMLRTVGIRASVQSHPPAQRVQLINQGKVELGYYGWDGSSSFESSGPIGRHVDSNEYADPALAKLADATRLIMDDAARRMATAKVFDYITEQAYAFVMVPSRATYTHTKEVKLNAPQGVMRATPVNPHEFAWK